MGAGIGPWGDLWPDLPDGARVELEERSVIPQVAAPPLPLVRVGELEERIAKQHRVPYWLISSHPRPSWFRRPIWRLRALRWGWR